jgi:hypothetical protein
MTSLPMQAMQHTIIAHAVHRFKEYAEGAAETLTFYEAKEILNKALRLTPEASGFWMLKTWTRT